VSYHLSVVHFDKDKRAAELALENTTLRSHLANEEFAVSSLAIEADRLSREFTKVEENRNLQLNGLYSQYLASQNNLIESEASQQTLSRELRVLKFNSQVESKLLECYKAGDQLFSSTSALQNERLLKSVEASREFMDSYSTELSLLLSANADLLAENKTLGATCESSAIIKQRLQGLYEDRCRISLT
jgi:hypothetical protein